MEIKDLKNNATITDDEAKKIIGNNLTKFRKRNSTFTQRKLSTELEKSTSYINQVEKGILEIDLLILIKLCQEFKCTPNDILADFFNFRPNLPGYNNLSEKSQKHINNTLDLLIELEQIKREKQINKMLLKKNLHINSFPDF